MLKIIKTLLILMALVWLLSACSGQNDADESIQNNAGNQPADGAGQDMATEEDQDYGDAERAEADAETGELPEQGGSERYIIYEGNMHLEVRDYQTAVSDIEEQTAQVNGYIVESSTNRSGEDGRRSGRMVVRVPQEDFFSFIDDLEESDAEVLEQHTSGNDVTEEYVDLESRLRTQEAVEERLTAFMENADTTEDLLNISNELAEVQEKIETIQGRINYLDNRVDYSTLHLQISERPETELQDREELQTWDRALEQFMGTINGLVRAGASMTVFLIGYSPLLIPAIFIAVIVYVYRRRNNQKDVELNKEDDNNRSENNGSSEEADK